MQVIRLSRTGKQNQASFRIVVAEKARAVKGAYQEILGHYSPSENKKIDFNKDRIDYWISKGARPSDSVAALLKTNGVSGLEKYMEPRNKKKRSKSAPAEEPRALMPEVASAPAETAPVEKAPPA